MANKLFRYCGVAVVALLCTAYAITAQTSDMSPNRPSDLMPQELIQRKAWSLEIQDARKQRIYDLLSIVRTKKDDVSEQRKETQLWHAVRLLGEYRAEEAKVPLMDLIDLVFLPVAFHRSEDTNEELIRSLAAIGKPASRLAIEYLAKDKSTPHAVRYLRVIYLVEGADEGKLMLQNAASKERDPERKARLNEAITLFGHADSVVP